MAGGVQSYCVGRIIFKKVFLFLVSIENQNDCVYNFNLDIDEFKENSKLHRFITSVFVHFKTLDYI